MIINSVMGILSQFKCVSDHHVVHLKYATILFVIYLSKAGKQQGKAIDSRERAPVLCSMDHAMVMWF